MIEHEPMTEQEAYDAWYDRVYNQPITLTVHKPDPALNAFCPTGPGGGQDDSCSSHAASAKDLLDRSFTMDANAAKAEAETLVADKDKEHLADMLKAMGMYKPKGSAKAMRARVVQMVMSMVATGTAVRGVDKLFAHNAFCPTGPGGGQDDSCAPGSKFVGKPVGWKEREHADNVELHIADVLGHKHESDMKFYDTKSKDDKHFVEVKTMLKGEKQVVNAHPDALLRKVEGIKEFPGATFHTVVRDDRGTYESGEHAENYSGHNLYYKRGNDRYPLSQMHKVKSEAELKKLIKMKDEDLPEAAKGSLPSGKAEVAKLKKQAADADAKRKGRDAARRAKAKAEGRNIYERQT